jgi:glc operon protein GlcG
MSQSRAVVLLVSILGWELGAPTPSPAQVLDAKALGLEGAKRIAEAAESFARKRGWRVVIVVADQGGEPIVLHRMDDVQHASVDLALGKARTSARFRRPTKALADGVAAGRIGFLGVEGVVPLEGGVPVTSGGTVIGAVGVSGMTGAEDAEVATAGIAALGP